MRSTQDERAAPDANALPAARVEAPTGGSHAALARLQQAVGNRAMQRMFKRPHGGGAAPPPPPPVAPAPVPPVAVAPVAPAPVPPVAVAPVAPAPVPLIGQILTAPGRYGGLTDRFLLAMRLGDVWRLRLASRDLRANVDWVLAGNDPRRLSYLGVLATHFGGLVVDEALPLLRQLVDALLAQNMRVDDFRRVVRRAATMPPNTELTASDVLQSLQSTAEGSAVAVPLLSAGQTHAHKRSKVERHDRNELLSAIRRARLRLALTVTVESPLVRPLELAALLVHNPNLALAQAEHWHAHGFLHPGSVPSFDEKGAPIKKPAKGEKKHKGAKYVHTGEKSGGRYQRPDTQGTTCIGYHRRLGQYFAARQGMIPRVPEHSAWQASCTRLGLPNGPIRVIRFSELDLRVESTGVHAESYIIRYLWLRFLRDMGADVPSATQLHLLIFYADLQANLVLGASQPACWDCAGNASRFSIAHGPHGEQPSNYWVDPITGAVFNETHNPREGPKEFRAVTTSQQELPHKKRPPSRKRDRDE